MIEKKKKKNKEKLFKMKARYLSLVIDFRAVKKINKKIKDVALE